MLEYEYIVTGSSGFLGGRVVKFLTEQGHSVLGIDLTTGHDLSCEEFTKDFFSKHSARNLINLFAVNDKVESISEQTDIFNLDLDHFRKTLEINVVTLFSVCREFIRNNGDGRIVNISSIYGVRSADPTLYAGGEKPASYGVSKAAVINLSQHLAIHAAPGIRVNTIVLGGVGENQDQAFVGRYSNRVPLGRMAEPADIMGAIMFLTSDSAGYLTGSTITVDGGWLAK